MEVIIALKNMVQDETVRPELVSGIYHTIINTGRSAPVLGSLNKRRDKMGLPPLPQLDMDEITAILAPDKTDGNSGSDTSPRKESK